MVGGSGRAAQFGASRKGWLGSGGESGTDLDISWYDKEIRRPIVFYARWYFDGERVSDDFVCLGLDVFQPNSRTLADALRDEEGNAKSNGTSMTNQIANQMRSLMTSQIIRLMERLRMERMTCRLARYWSCLGRLVWQHSHWYSPYEHRGAWAVRRCPK